MQIRENLNFFEKAIDKREKVWYTIKVITSCSGGIAQLARAIGSYPIGRGFKSNFRYQHKADVVNNKICLMIRPVGQAVKTPPFHGGNSSSILLRVTKNKKENAMRSLFLFFMSCPRMRTRQLARGDFFFYLFFEKVGVISLFVCCQLRHQKRGFWCVRSICYGSPYATNPNYFVNRNWFGFVF